MDQCFSIIEAARSSKPYLIQELDYSDILDLKDLTKRLMTPSQSQQISWLNLKWLRFVKGEPDVIYFKYDMDEPFRELRIRARRGRPEKVFEKPIAKRYSSRIPISTAKKADLKKMCDLRIIKERHHPFYKSLPSEGSVKVS